MSDKRFAGIWTTTFGRLSVTQQGDKIFGTYPHQGGKLSGEVQGEKVSGTWIEPDHQKEGSFEWTLGQDGHSFHGFWNYKGDSGWFDVWNGIKAQSPAETGEFVGGWNSYAEGPLLSGPMVGQVADVTARIWAQARDTSPLTLVVWTPEGAEICAKLNPRQEEWLCVTFDVVGLMPSTVYRYELHSQHGRTAEGQFKTAPPADARQTKIVFGSCFWDFPNHGLTIFDAIGREQGDLWVILGDSSYMVGDDWQSEHNMMMTHLRNRNNDRLRKLVATTPTLAVWDDHDFGPSDSNGHFEGKQESLRAFRRCWAQFAFGTPSIPGVFSTVRCGPVEMFMLDSRYYKALEGKNILGKAQLGWLFDRLDASTAPVKIIASPTQVLPKIPVPKGWDCFRGDAPDELEAIMAHIETHDIRGVVFVSGDLHMANLLWVPGRVIGSRIGPEWWELTSSPLAQVPWNEAAAGADSTIVREVIDRTNYGVIDVDLDRAGREVVLALNDADGKPLMRQPIDLLTLAVR